MIVHNLYYSTLLKEKDKNNLIKDIDYREAPTGNCFVTENIIKV